MAKSPDAFKTISEAAEALDLPQHVLRFWETRFSQIKPMKRGGGRRYYRPADVELLQGIKTLLYGEGYTIKGVQKILAEQGIRHVIAIGNGLDPAQLASQPQTAVDESSTDALTNSTPDAAEDEFVHAQDLPGTPAVRVGAFVERANAEENSGLFSKFTQRAEASKVSKTDQERLQAALVDLLECKRLLDQVR